MHDLCFTISYGMKVFCGGLIGFARKASMTSLAGGVGTGLLLFLASYLTLSDFHKRKNSWVGLILETVCDAALTWVMGQ
ncbi:putative TMEM14 family protein [Helianthus annuus]|nr:putative TMEM14 family protein [Helianthus annuus]KAJ0770995.1 putative TMEM14 family protein [Helianthus annuus]